MIYFAPVNRFNGKEINLPERKTARSAGYDFEVAEDIIIPSYDSLKYGLISDEAVDVLKHTYTLEDMAAITKRTGIKPTLVPTGVKCYLDPDTYLELSLRSSTPLKYWLVMANSLGIIDSDYAGNSENDGEIYFQLINLSPFDIQLKKGDIIGQGIIKHYLKTDDDNAKGKRNGGFGSTSK